MREGSGVDQTRDAVAGFVRAQGERDGSPCLRVSGGVLIIRFIGHGNRELGAIFSGF